jgi:DNA-binding response OmpR family regulator
MCAHIVLAEDDEKQAELVRLYLEREQHTVTVVRDGLAAIDEVRRLRPELLVLDIMLPLVDGLDVARILRAESDVAVLMLTARSTEEDLLLGLELGADDYVTKPFSPRELMARVRTLLRRTATTVTVTEPEPPLTVGPLVIDQLQHLVTMSGRPIECTPGEFRLLAALASEPGRVFSREQLLDQLHGFDRYITYRTIDVHILNLRKKLEPEPSAPRHLLTVFGVGYKLVGDAP